MPKLPRLYPKEILAVLLRLDFYVHHQVGSHAQLRHRHKTHLRVTVPRHDRFELPPFVVNSILKQAEIARADFVKLLKKRPD
jgi:predicted RNA binding protein YcfA (HicA-like mRNA interferase family)